MEHPIQSFDPTAELAGLRAALDACDALRQRRAGGLAQRAVGVSAWSSEQHLYHLALSTDLALGNVRAIGRGSGLRLTREGGPNALAREVLARGSRERGSSEAPRMVRPPDEVDPAFLVDELGRARSALDAVEAELEAVAASDARVPHQELGQLSGAEWLRFAHIHVRHHLAILDDIESALLDGSPRP